VGGNFSIDMRLLACLFGVRRCLDALHVRNPSGGILDSIKAHLAGHLGLREIGINIGVRLIVRNGVQVLPRSSPSAGLDQSVRICQPRKTLPLGHIHAKHILLVHDLPPDFL
jgi:hypothetical protein